MSNYIFKEIPPEHIDTRMELETTLDIIGSDNIYIFGNNRLNSIGDNLISCIYKMVDDEILKDTLNDTYELFDRFDGDLNNCLHDFFSDVGVDWYSLSNSQKSTIVYNLLYWGDVRQASCNILAEIIGNNYDWDRINGCVQGDWQYVIYNSDKIDSSMLERIEALYFNTANAWHCDELDITVYTNTLSPKFEISDQTAIPVEDILLQDFQGWERIAVYGEAE